MEILHDEYVWIQDHKELCWSIGKIIGHHNDKNYLVESIDDEGEYIVNKSKAIKANLNSIEGHPNLLSLDELNEGTMLTTIRKRYNDDKIYTSIGSSILVSLNPYWKLPIYTIQKAQEWRKFRNGAGDESVQPDPHLFMVAESSYQDLITDKHSQSIIVTGESGAGKTEATKIILSYLAKCKDDFSKSSAKQADLSDFSNVSNQEVSLEKQVLDSNPLLEAFGNAKTVKNNNSSRFGKFIQVNVDNSGKIISATIQNYLLEKSRIVHQSSKERNFHIFYYVFLDESIIEAYELDNIDCYNYLANSFIDAIPEEEDRMCYEIMKNCLEVLGFTDEEYNEIIDLVIGILNLGNLEFEEVYIPGKQDQANVTSDTKVYLEKVSRFFNIDNEFVEKALTAKAYKVQNEYTLIDITESEAIELRDSMAKIIYARMFNWIISLSPAIAWFTLDMLACLTGSYLK